MKVLTKDCMQIIDIPENASLSVEFINDPMVGEKYWYISVNHNRTLGTFETENKAINEIVYLFEYLKNGKEFYEM